MNQMMNPPPDLLPPEAAPPSKAMAKGPGAEEMRKKRTATVKNIDFLPPMRKSIRGPILRFSLYAWAKLLAFRDYGTTEIAGFGVAHGDDPLLIEDFITVKQSCTAVTVAMNDESVADYFDQQFDHNLKPEQFARVWVHTHPGSSANPSGTDEETFHRVFGACDWAVMAILARGGQTYARLRFGVGPGGQMLIPVQVDYGAPFPGSDHEAWQAEYERNVIPETPALLRHLRAEDDTATTDSRACEGHDVTPRIHRTQHWRDGGDWDIHDLNDLEALAELEAELENELNEQSIREEMEVGFDSR